MADALLVAGAAAVVCMAPLVAAQDAGNLDVLRPLRVEDAYTVSEGEIVLETGVDFVDEHHETDRWQAPIEVVWGALPNTQLELGTWFATDPHEVTGQERPGDTHVGALYNFNHETTSTPALALRVDANLPTGGDSDGVDFELKGVTTKSFDRLSLHLNVGYRWLNGVEGGERDSGYELVLGASYPLGAPEDTRTTLLADAYVEQGPQHGDEDIVGIEAGVRRQIAPRTVVDVGIGRDVDGPSTRDDLRVTAGLSLSF